MKSTFLLSKATFMLLIAALPFKGDVHSSINQNPEATISKSMALQELLLPNPFVISSEKVSELTAILGIGTEELLKQLIPIAQSFARSPVSNYKVGIAALGKSGKIFLGVNLEFPGLPLNETVHGEQFLITNARSHGEKELVVIALSAAPCGHCRQFMNEMGGDGSLQLLICDAPSTSLSSLLPEAFGPKDLGLTGGLLTPINEQVFANPESPLLAYAINAACISYAPYTNSKAGVAIQTKKGKIYSGSYLENAAYNPSMAPLQAALISLVADLQSYDEISEVILVEQMNGIVSQELMTRAILKSIAPEAKLSVEKRDL